MVILNDNSHTVILAHNDTMAPVLWFGAMLSVARLCKIPHAAALNLNHIIPRLKLSLNPKPRTARWSLQELCPADGIEGEVCVRGGCPLACAG